MSITQGNHSASPQHDQAIAPFYPVLSAIFILAAIVAVTIIFGLMAADLFTADQMYIIRPLLATFAVFSIFSYLLKLRVQTAIFGEIGFIYLAFALAYTILPAITLLKTDFIIPPGYDGAINSILTPLPADFGAHFWRHVLFISGVALGYLAVRGGSLPIKPLNDSSTNGNGRIVAVMIAIVGFCIVSVMLLSSPVSTYYEHYTRFDHLSWPLRRLVYVGLIFKSGGYFVLLALLFSDYRRYRLFIFIVIPALCAYESIYSFGSRIEALTILLASVGFYHYRVTPISIKKGMMYLVALAFLFSVVELIRASDNSLEDARYSVSEQGLKQASEFGAVYYTGFHLYAERAQGTLPPRNWQMFFYEFLSLIPFIDHTEHHPQYWYARHFFPEAVVPPQTMGVIADSAIWGGEFDLFVRSLINGAVFAFLTRWFLLRREKWWALTIYIYCYATCIMTLKYSVFYQLTPLTKIILPTLVLTGALFHLQNSDTRLKPILRES